jgi:hypothetical protein
MSPGRAAWDRPLSEKQRAIVAAGLVRAWTAQRRLHYLCWEPGTFGAKPQTHNTYHPSHGNEEQIAVFSNSQSSEQSSIQSLAQPFT